MSLLSKNKKLRHGGNDVQESIASDHLKYWIESHGLPKHFPILKKRQEIRPFLRYGGKELDRISTNVSGSFRSVIVFPEGQGATTHVLELIDRKRASPDNHQVYVLLDLESLTVEDFKSSWKKIVCHSVLRTLATDRWADKQQGIFCQKLVALLDRRNAADVLEFGNDLISGEQEAEDFLDALTEAWSNRLLDLLQYVSDEIALDVVLCFDISSQILEDDVKAIIRELKWFDENDKRDWLLENEEHEEYNPKYMREAYFVPDSLVDSVLAEWQVGFERFDVAPYTTLEVFSILEKHFRPRRAWRTYGDTREPGPSDSEGRLSGLFSDEYVQEVWDGTTSLIGFSEQLKERLLSDLENVEKISIKYLLAPGTK